MPIVSKNSGGGYNWICDYDEELTYDGSIKSLVRAIEHAEKNKTRIVRDLKVKIKKMNEIEAALTLSKEF